MRVCIVATRLADRLGLSPIDRSHIYFASLLRHVGCTAYAHEEALLFGGDEITARAAVATRDMGNPRDALSFSFTAVGANLDPVRRAGAIAHALVRTPGAIQELAASNCEVGSMVARRLDLPEPIQIALNQVYERWDGKGWPNKWLEKGCRSSSA